MGIVSAIAKFLSALLNLPGIWQRWREHKKDVKIENLQLEIAQKDAKVNAEHLHQEFVETQQKTRKKIQDDAKIKTIDSIIDYFGKS
jgi:hypothetical protein